MGGSESTRLLGALGASFEAALAREEEVAADDLAFSLRQDVDARTAIVRSGTGWDLVDPDGGSTAVEEVGADYVVAGTAAVRLSVALLRTGSGPAPRATDSTFLEVLGRWCRCGTAVSVEGRGTSRSGHLTRVGRDHVALRSHGAETIVGLAAVDAVRAAGYSASRGFNG